ncbi:hypothetical protein EIP91_006784 [Steccherinum ochraceum]|uniref:Ubiquitin-like protease family profile domain-containing protein n=1 Tax=Steccherinum ochraceum TaxID=92696 RepID=A0A4R0R539_9APHY|nr:hypothetical protein EIP91_006784 [Steccherinum ochraceum]
MHCDSPPDTTVDLSKSPPPFIASKFIACGRSYPSTNIPVEVKSERERLFTVPPAIRRQLLPASDTSVEKFLQYTFPPLRKGFSVVNSTHSFSKNPPQNFNIESFKKRPVPRQDFLDFLERVFGQAWFDGGGQSIVDHQFNRGQDRLPLWAHTVWTEMRELSILQEEWKRGLRWLTGVQGSNASSIAKALEWADIQSDQPLSKISKDATEIIRVLAVLGHRTRIPGSPSILGSDLLPLLGQRCLDNNVMDALIYRMTDRLKTERKEGSVVVCATRISRMLQEDFMRKLLREKGDVPTRVYELEQTILSNSLLYLPFFVNGNHWIAVCIDFKARTIAYGDSLALNDAPRKVMDAIQLWLRVRFDGPYQERGNVLVHGTQQDTVSCGICTMNTVSHAVFNDKVWSTESLDSERVKYLKELTFQVPLTRHATASESESLPAKHTMQSYKYSLATILNDDAPPIDLQERSASSGILSTASKPPSFHESEDVPADASDIDMLTSSVPASPALSFATGQDDVAMMSSSEFPPASSPASSHRSSMDLLPSASSVAASEGSVSSMGSGKGSKSKLRTFWGKLKPTRKKGDNGDTSSGDSDASMPDAPKLNKSKTKTTLSKPPPANHSESQGGPIGISKSALWARNNRKAVKEGKFEIDELRFADWAEKILEMDENAELDRVNAKEVRHSFCGELRQMRESYDFTRFREHVESCKGPKHVRKKAKKNAPPKGVPGIAMFMLPQKEGGAKEGITKPPVGRFQPQKPPEKPCPGLTVLDDERVGRYLERTLVFSAGGPKLEDVAKARFNKPLGELSGGEKKQVRFWQAQEHQWRNDFDEGRVVHVDCKKLSSGLAKSGRDPERPLPCSECLSLLRRNNRFRSALNQKIPERKNLKYTNKKYRHETLGLRYAEILGLRELLEADLDSTPCVRYALGVLQGEYEDMDVFAGLMQGVVVRHERLKAGKGMQNFPHAVCWREVMHVVSMHSPRALRLMQEHLPAPHLRTFQMQRAREPKFPTIVGERTFTRVTDYLAALSYDGPVALSCDDTKLFASFRLSFDAQDDCHYLIGGVGDPLRVANPDALDDVLKEASVQKATKVRLWCLQIPLPKAPPIIVAARAISESNDAISLVGYLEPILHGLLERHVRVVSYSSDGTTIERNVQHSLLKTADRVEEVVVKGSRAGVPAIRVKFPVIRGQPIAMVQDSKHALKTFRNNLFSGARLLVLGNFIPGFDHILDIALSPDSPLYHRDVLKVDRQDDNAASRLFSAATLDFINTNYPEYRGEIVYLFVFGELVDAYQNRSITHGERLQMVLRAYYFLLLWEASLTAAGYKKDKFFLSREAVDITKILVEGYISLLIIYRDHLPSLHPLLPWMHSTEPCEHVFGESRQIVPDFTMLDFYHMLSKLTIALRQAAYKSRASDARATASGYNHTYYDSRGFDPLALATFPTASDIPNIADSAAEEADSLARLLGLNPALLRKTQTHSALPSIQTWLPDDPSERQYEPDTDSDTDSDTDDLINEEPQAVNDADDFQTLCDWFHEVETKGPGLRPHMTDKEDNEITRIQCAGIALQTDEMIRIDSLPEMNEDELQEVYKNDAEYVARVMAEVQPEAEKREAKGKSKGGPVKIPDLELTDETVRPFGLDDFAGDGPGTDFTTLVDLRRAHQTRQAETGVRTKKLGLEDTAQAEKQGQVSARRQLADGMRSVLNKWVDQDGVGPTTTSGRILRWVGVYGGTAGNSANAALAATTAAKKELTKRKKVFVNAKVPRLAQISTASVTELRPLRRGDFGFVWTPHGIMLAQVTRLCSKGGGAGGKHSCVDASTIITGLSNIAVQLFEYGRNRKLFTSIPEATSALWIKQYDLMKPSMFLTLLESKPIAGSDASGANPRKRALAESVTGMLTYSLGVADTKLYEDLTANLAAFDRAKKLFAKRAKKEDDDGAAEEEE